MRIAPKPKEGQGISLDSLLKPTRPAQTPIDRFSLKTGPESTILTGIKINGAYHRVEVSHTLLPKQKPSDAFIEWSNMRLEHDVFRPASCEEIYQILHPLIVPQSGMLGEEEQRFISTIQGVWLVQPILAYTTFHMNLGGCDYVDHLPLTSIQWKREGQLTGTNGQFGQVENMRDVCAMLFGNSDHNQTANVFESFSLRRPHIERVGKGMWSGSAGWVVMGWDYVCIGTDRYESPDGYHTIGIRTSNGGDL